MSIIKYGVPEITPIEQKFVDQSEYSAQWYYLGEYDLDEVSRVEMYVDAENTGIADAIKFQLLEPYATDEGIPAQGDNTNIESNSENFSISNNLQPSDDGESPAEKESTPGGQGGCFMQYLFNQ